ncbi:PREDICTED: zinc finger BED domain-containing protein 1-like, partial [Wasmannia auropunctata]|uniref:zinc finger BED domain-containing protein 1-like n=1 Tax=Wasmannia auropunctata TaxID=64793 RepID=UPI0005EE6E5F
CSSKYEYRNYSFVVADESDGKSKTAEITNALLFMVAKDNMPLNSVDKAGCRYLLKVFAPLYKIPGRQQFTDLMDKKYEVLSLLVKQKLETVESITLTCDVWTEVLNTVSFLGISAHYIYNNVLTSTTMGVFELDQWHIGEYLGEVLLSVCNNWNMPISKIKAVVTDNGANIHAGNTTNLTQHLNRKHANFTDNESQETDQQQQQHKTTRSYPKTVVKIDKAFKKMKSYKAGGEMSNQLTNSLMYMLAVDNLPLSTVEHTGFLHFCKKAVPLYTPPSRKTITSLMDDKYSVLKNIYKSRFQKLQNVTITTDIWTDVSVKSYIGVTIHYLDDKLEFVNTTIGVISLDESHTEEYIGLCLMQLCQDWGINIDCITAIVTDNAANIVKAITDTFGKKKHLRCFAHTLSLVYPDAVKTIPSLVNLLAKVKSIVTLFKQSVVAADELRRLQFLEGKTEGTVLKLIQEVPTRWNSAFYMIQRFLQLKDYINNMLLKCPKAPNMIVRDELEVLQEIVDILKPIEYVTKTIGGDTYTTSSLVIPLIHYMMLTVKKCTPITDTGIQFKENILTELNKRFQHVESVSHLAIATLMDPRFKKTHFESPLALSTAIQHINNMIEIDLGNQNNEIIQTKASVVERDEQSNNFWKMHKELVASIASKRQVETTIQDNNIELKQYLSQPVIHDTANPIEYWKMSKHVFPLLYPVAIKYLSIVATSVPAERLFSKAGNTKTNLRNRLTDNGSNTIKLIRLLENDQLEECKANDKSDETDNVSITWNKDDDIFLEDENSVKEIEEIDVSMLRADLQL